MKLRKKKLLKRNNRIFQKDRSGSKGILSINGSVIADKLVEDQKAVREINDKFSIGSYSAYPNFI